MTDDEFERKSRSILGEYFTIEKIEVNINIYGLFEGRIFKCGLHNCFLGCCSRHEGMPASIDHSQIYQSMLAARTRT